MREGLKIAMLINGYHPRIGGAERQLGAIAPRLQSRGLQVHVLTRRYPGLAAYEEIDGVPVHRLPVPGPKPLASLSYTLSALALLRKINPDILHSHELFSTTTTAVAAKVYLKRPVVATPHSSGSHGEIKRLKNKFLGRQRLQIFKRVVDCFVTISRRVEKELTEAGVEPGKLVHIPNAVDVARFCPSPSSAQARLSVREKLGFPPDSLIVVFTGRLSEEKRPGNLIKAWPKVFGEFPGARLLILGSGKLENELHSQLSEGITLLGRVDDVLPYLQGSDVFALPSAAEGLPVSLLEAMACGLPSVATAVGGTPEVLENDRNGILIPPDDIPALQTALLALLKAPETRLRMGAAARAVVETRFSLEMAVDRLAGLYERLSAEEGSTL